MAAIRVLAVDDNPRNVAIIRKSLGSEAETVEAGCGEDAFEIASRMRPDIVLLDVMMPGIDGYETCRRIRARPECAHVKIIMVSARASSNDRLVGYEAGADDYVVKPFDPDELLAKVRVYARLKSVEELDRAKSDLLTLLGHETRTPLTTILTPLALLRDEPGLSEEARHLVGIAEKGGLKLLHLIERACFVTQLRIGGIEFHLEDHDLSDLVGTAIHGVRARSEERGVKIVADLPGGIPVRVDADMLGKAIGALLDNALRFSPPGGEVAVTVSARASDCTIAVSDKGPGIAPELQPRLFQSFVVGDIAHHHSGCGLGLTTVHAIATRHRGSVTVSTATGAGSVFRIHLPLAMPARAAA